MLQPDICKLCLDYALSEIKDELTKRRFARHLSQCKACQDDFLEYKDMIQAITQPDAVVSGSDRPLQLVDDSIKPYSYQRARFSLFLASRMGRWSLSATAVLTVLVTLLHGGHFHHVRTLGAHTLHRVSQVVSQDKNHLKQDFRRL